jgi:aspartyl-tRNA(Asn)/glutamyl-tRNA(Gln) amidotransferase subunit C
MELKDIENLAELAKIELTIEEKQKILADMDGILAYVKQIEDIDVPDIEIEYKHRNAWREDDAGERIFDRERIIGQFPDSQDNFVKVKKIL